MRCEVDVTHELDFILYLEDSLEKVYRLHLVHVGHPDDWDGVILLFDLICLFLLHDEHKAQLRFSFKVPHEPPKLRAKRRVHLFRVLEHNGAPLLA